MASVSPLITVISPSVRAEMLPIVAKCLQRQTYSDYEWIVVSPEDYGFGRWIQDPPRNEGDYYSLNKAWNAAFKVANGELIVSIQDGIWFDPLVLEKFWDHYTTNPKAIVGAVGNQFKEIVAGKPEGIVWQDPRLRNDLGTFYEVGFEDVEWTVCSITKQALLDIGGLDEEYDKGAAMSEKEANLRMQFKGYAFYLDQTIRYRALHHERLSKDWDERYNIAIDLYKKHVHEILDNKRGKLDYL